MSSLMISIAVWTERQLASQSSELRIRIFAVWALRVSAKSSSESAALAKVSEASPTRSLGETLA